MVRDRVSSSTLSFYEWHLDCLIILYQQNHRQLIFSPIRLLPTSNMLCILACLGLLAVASAHSASLLSTHQQSQLYSARTTCSKSFHCVLTQESSEGPFYVDHPLIRSSITEDRDGIPLALEIDLVDVTTCKSAVGAMVDIWHASVQGEYSGWAGIAEGSSQDSLKKRGTPVEDSTWLRGVQPSDKHGRVVFDTIIPGWYPGRATHIHIKVHVGNVTVDDGVLLGGGNMSHTGQLFFSDDFITNISETREPYISRRKQMKPVLNGDDGQYVNDDGAEQVVTVTKDGESHTGKVTVGIDPSADHHDEGGHGPPRHGPPRGPGGHHGSPGHKDRSCKGHKSHKNGRRCFDTRNILVAAGAFGAVVIGNAVWGLRRYMKSRTERHTYSILSKDEPGMEDIK